MVIGGYGAQVPHSLPLATLASVAHAGTCYSIVNSELRSIGKLRLPVSAQALCLETVRSFGGETYTEITLFHQNIAVAKFSASEIKGKCFNSNCNTYSLKSGIVANLGNVSSKIQGSKLQFNEPYWKLAIDDEVFEIARTK